MQCIKTGAHIYIAQYGEFAICDVFELNGVYLFRIAGTSREPMRDVIHFNVGVGVSVRLGEGVRARAVQDAADWLAHNGQKCLAMEAMLDLHPDLRRMNKTVKCVKH